MRTKIILSGTLACLFSALQGLAQTPSAGGYGIEYMPEVVKPPVAKAVSDAELKRRRATEKFSGFVTEEQKSKGWDLMEYSEFIGMDGYVTLLPKGSILLVPERLKANVLPKAVGRFLPWPEFSARYRGLVSVREVTMDECSGKKQIDVKSFDAARKSGLIIVAIHAGSPISVAKSALPTQTETASR